MSQQQALFVEQFIRVHTVLEKLLTGLSVRFHVAK